MVYANKSGLPTMAQEQEISMNFGNGGTLVEKGSAYGYFPNASKTWLIVKAEKMDETKRIFEGTGVQFTSEGMRHLGAAIGSQTFKESYLQKKIDEWIKNVFRDAIYLRYGWEPRGLPEMCRCGARFNVAHAMQCMTGGYRGRMHNEVQYVFYDTFKQAGYKDVVWEPELQALEG